MIETQQYPLAETKQIDTHEMLHWIKSTLHLKIRLYYYACSTWCFFRGYLFSELEI